MAEASTTYLQGLIARASTGDLSARDDLLKHTYNRLLRLTHRMLQDFPRVRQWEETDDVLQNAQVRLLRALEAVNPASLRDFFALASAQIRRELLDLARHYFGPEGAGKRQVPLRPPGTSEGTPHPA